MVRAAPKPDEVRVDEQDSKQKDSLFGSIVPVDETIDAPVPRVRAALTELTPVSGDTVEQVLPRAERPLPQEEPAAAEAAPIADPAEVSEPEPAAVPAAPPAPVAQAVAQPAPAPVPAATPAPAPARTGLLVAMSMGGGVLLGGGVVTGLALLVLGAGVGILTLGASFLLLANDGGPMPAPSAEIENPVAEAPVASPVTPADASAGGTPEAVEVPGEEAPAAVVPGTSAPAAGAPSAATPSATPASPAAPKTEAPSAPKTEVPRAEQPAAEQPAAEVPVAAPAPKAAPAPAPAKPAAAPNVVLVRIRSEPPAALLTVDGEARGRTPTKLELEPGTHQISLTAGSSKGAFTIDVAPGDDKFCYGLSGKKIVRTSCE